jgi:prepilin-type N-terminal cleavage/methylation domain-containing protein
MLARIRKAREEGQGGFTLIELLVVMIIIGILAAIAIPVFLNQRKKAQDSAAKADVSTIGKEVATYYVDNTAAPTLALNAAGTRYELAGQDIGKVSANVELGTSFFTDSTDWCVSVFNDEGDKAKSPSGYKYSSADGLAEGQCTVATP